MSISLPHWAKFPRTQYYDLDPNVSKWKLRRFSSQAQVKALVGIKNSWPFANLRARVRKSWCQCGGLYKTFF